MGYTDCFRARCSRVHIPEQRGSYSIERMCALHEYSQYRYIWQSLLILVISVIPSLILIVILDSMPLQDPSKGWDKNPTMFIRFAVSTYLLSIGVLFMLRALVPAAGLTLRHCLTTSLLAQWAPILTSLLVAKYWVYPVPFLMVVVNPAWSLSMFAIVVIVVGPKNLKHPELKTQLRRFFQLVNLSSSFIVIFPGYITIFRSLNGVSQFSFLFVLPVLKYLLKKATRQIFADVEELMPLVVVTVDLFNALFQAKCMQTSGTIWTTVGIIGIDVIQNVYSLRKLFRYMSDVQEMMRHQSGSRELLQYCVTLVRTSEHLSQPTTSQLESVAVPPAGSTKDLQCWGALSSANEDIQQSSSKSPDTPSKNVGLNAVVPWALTSSLEAKAKKHRLTSVVPIGGKDQIADDAELSSEQQAAVLKKTLGLLWKCESALLVEYIETAVPLVYGISMGILYYLPNAKYYPGVAEMSPEKLKLTILSILAYSSLEFGSLVYLHAILKWKFQISALHQLGFVLEKQWPVVQGLFLMWVILVLSFTLVHYGTCDWL